MNKSEWLLLFEYDYWANTEALKSIANAPSNRAAQLFSHVVEAKKLWYDRIYSKNSLASVWNAWTLEESERQINLFHDLWVKFISQLNASTSGEVIHYRNTKGIDYESTVEEILMHVIQHSGYHRGQIALEIRKAGGEPAYTDYIQYCRSDIKK